MLLMQGNSFADTAKKLEMAPEMARDLKWHLYQKHVRGPTRENYTILLVDYLQDAMGRLKREYEKNPKQQRPQLISLYHKAHQWVLDGYARMEGLNLQGNKKLSGDVIAALNELANGNPDAVKRIAEARKKETPILTQATKVEDPVKFENGRDPE